MFTPDLAKWYDNFQKKNPDKKLTIVFVSSDRSEHDFDEYRKEMNFHALPYGEREVKGKLSATFGVRGIPTLIFFDADGNLCTKDGRAVVGRDRDGAEYPWKPKPFSEQIAGPLLSHSGETIEFSGLTGKHIAFYFSATGADHAVASHRSLCKHTRL